MRHERWPVAVAAATAIGQLGAAGPLPLPDGAVDVPKAAPDTVESDAAADAAESSKAPAVAAKAAEEAKAAQEAEAGSKPPPPVSRREEPPTTKVAT